MFELDTLLVVIPGLPLLACILTALLGPKLLREYSHLPTVAALVLAFLCSLMLLSEVNSQQDRLKNQGMVGYEHTYTLWTWAWIGDAETVNLPTGDRQAANFVVDVTLRADGLTAVMLAMVTFVASLVAIYSVGYMHGDRGYWRFFTFFALFVFSMTMLVSVSNFVLLYVFWEAVGLCSYLLIGFWYQKPEAASAGKKAFLVNRVGDFGFALGIFLIWTTFGTLNFHDAQGGVPGVLGQTYLKSPAAYTTLLAGGVGTAICLLLLLGACGKSAQFPLHVWLPDAMEGPTPVSALIHAATMVTAGGYMVARCTPLFASSATAQMAVACVGGLTALIAAISALTQFDLKRILAYSTISQLGYMFLALGAGGAAGVGAGMFHLFTHAFFKALLFLGAGSVMHAMGNVIDVRRFGGLRKIMPITCVTFAIGALALAGLFPLAGFWSKDAIIVAVHDAAFGEHSETHHQDESHGNGQPHAASGGAAAVYYVATNGANGTQAASTTESVPDYRRVYQLLYYASLFTAFLTAYYTFRAFFLTFFGEEEVPPEAGHHAHESPPVMTGPLVILAIASVVVGAVFYLLEDVNFESFIATSPVLAYLPHGAHHGAHLTVAATSTIVAVAGIGLAAFLYLGDRKELETLGYIFRIEWFEKIVDTRWISGVRRSGPVQGLVRGFDAVNLGWLIRAVGYLLLLLLVILMTPLFLLYMLSPYRISFNKFFFDEIYTGLVIWPLQGLAAVSFFVDRYLIDGLVNLCGWIPRVAGNMIRRLNMGLLSFYALSMALSVLVLLAAKLLWTG